MGGGGARPWRPDLLEDLNWRRDLILTEGHRTPLYIMLAIQKNFM